LPQILNAKGCDASNAFDEEVPEGDQDFSDDEREREQKQKKKNKKKGIRSGLGDKVRRASDDELEEGELVDDESRNRGNKRNQRMRQDDEPPHYSSNNRKPKPNFNRQGGNKNKGNIQANMNPYAPVR
jgi:H/ACA ribonucleoprotein complex non-core subunit NAF1